MPAKVLSKYLYPPPQDIQLVTDDQANTTVRKIKFTGKVAPGYQGPGSPRKTSPQADIEDVLAQKRREAPGPIGGGGGGGGAGGWRLNNISAFLAGPGRPRKYNTPNPVTASTGGPGRGPHGNGSVLGFTGGRGSITTIGQPQAYALKQVSERSRKQGFTIGYVNSLLDFDRFLNQPGRPRKINPVNPNPTFPYRRRRGDNGQTGEGGGGGGVGGF